jgi:hypothetical protein
MVDGAAAELEHRNRNAAFRVALDVGPGSLYNDTET